MKTISGDGSGAAGILQRAISGRVMIKHESFTGDLVDLDGSGFKPSNLTFTIEKDRAGIRFNGTPFPEGLMAEQRAGDIDPAGDLLSPFPIAVALLVAVESDWLLGVLGESGLGPATAGFILPEFGGKTYRARKMIRADREYARQGTGVAVTAAVEALGKQAERRQLANSAPSSGANITIPWITTAYYPTDYISHIAGRGSGKLGQIVEVNMDFQAQTTSLTLEDAVLALEQIGSVNSGGE
jgi:hypothetical protein